MSRMAMTCLHEADELENGMHYIPCAIYENEAGYRPMRGNGPYALPWYWGSTHEECLKRCDEYNAMLGLTPEDVREIITSSMILSF